MREAAAGTAGGAVPGEGGEAGPGRAGPVPLWGGGALGQGVLLSTAA